MAKKSESVWAHSIPLKQQVNIIKRLFLFAKPFKWYFYWSIIFSAVVSIINILLPKIIQIYFDDYLAKHQATMGIIWFFAGLYLFGMIIRAITEFGETYLYSMGAEYMLEDTRRILFKKLHQLGMRYFDQVPSGSILSRLTNDTMAFQNFWQLFSSLIIAIFSMVTAFFAMFTTDKEIALWLTIFWPFLGLIIWYYQKYSSRVYRRMREKLSALNNKLAESINGISVIQEFRQETRVDNEFQEVNSEYLATRKAMIRVNSLLLGPIINLFYALGTVVVLGIFGIHGLHSYVAAGVVYAFVTYLENFYNPMGQVMESFSDFQDGIVAGARVLRIVDEQTFAPQQHEQANATLTLGKIEFRHVTFSYDGKHPILKDVSFIAEPGQTIALVGQTGSGKTSIINILMRFYEFGSGEILLDDRDIRDYPMAELRSKMELVLQEPFMFYGTIKSNIRLFNEQITDEQIKEAAKFVSADTFIDKLPAKYDEKVIERGASYSTGEKQLIAFARTIATNPKILILDEATANIDTETEQLIQQSLAKMQTGRTTIAIAHRLSTIQHADTILVLHQGEIVERGTNDELMKQHGAYYDMIQKQNMAHEL
ncbi:ABC transporter ATP-binding protein [Weissella paramesenteroides]|uniref:ABC transporter ATP-binding protein n=1 Tax=Weissella paramesenteroides TaxID=1249 RepID=UPI00123B7F83|nr:ABC transporter ATP-binding protein [Weissella paramesenteroides]KAA8455907.1 ABC transporter ATP-binding protein [Weissella paramesenteroides]KAA8457300.1 ABC transporter ATP-binding protein [Weissella paramesenteroides]KAA8459744.1 ABC transporter ATP-binding protein [Weissella paramesenteroides]KAA8462388.1 ABC transporter ATP-binding protein [Weissella paramesenteroides]KAA8463592.1 ABC transporter ATP-binding protein [Weissella paramesenteroides]